MNVQTPVEVEADGEDLKTPPYLRIDRISLLIEDIDTSIKHN